MDLAFDPRGSALVGALLLALFATLVVISKYIKPKPKASHIADVPREKRAVDPSRCYTNITPLSDLDWEHEAPLSLRPFKPTYHLTMALENISMNNLVEIDKTYLNRIQLRREIMTDHPTTLAYRPGSEAAIHEFYIWMTQTYLLQRFPTVYSLVSNANKATHLVNKVTNESIPLHPSDPRAALHILGSHVDTDFLILLPSETDGKYALEAFVTCFPSGFSSYEKLGLPLAAIHKPVPGYAAKLEKSMDRFFANLPVGRIVKRANWSITTNDELYAESGNHLYAEGGDADHEKQGAGTSEAKSSLEDFIRKQREDVRVEDCRLRCERQTLHRLPETKALVFAFKTYLYTLADVKAEGSGEELANAVDGLAKGNVPDMHFYKRGVVWGEKVKQYLRS